ncbi:hypothetical protein GCM10027090_16770 [Sinomonas soli]
MKMGKKFPRPAKLPTRMKVVLCRLRFTAYAIGTIDTAATTRIEGMISPQANPRGELEPTPPEWRRGFPPFRGAGSGAPIEVRGRVFVSECRTTLFSLGFRSA